MSDSYPNIQHLWECNREGATQLQQNKCCPTVTWGSRTITVSLFISLCPVWKRQYPVLRAFLTLILPKKTALVSLLIREIHRQKCEAG